MRNEIDLWDVAALVALPIFAGMELGVWSFSVDVFGSYSFSEPLASYSNVDVTVALVGTVLSLLWIVATNEIDGSEYETEEYVGIVAGLLIVPAYALIPAITDLVDSNDVVAFVAWLLVAVLAVFISYVE